MSALVVTPAYAELLQRIPPRVIHTEVENERYIEALYALQKNHAELSTEEREYADLLTLLIENFEEQHYQLPKASPVEVIAFLLDQHGLRQKDLADVFGTPSVVSEVMSGKRSLTRDYIARLSERFQVSPEVFF